MLTGTGEMNWPKWHENRAANRANDARRKEALAEIARADISGLDYQTSIAAAAANADPQFVPQPSERPLDPRWAGYTEDELADLANIEIAGMRVYDPPAEAAM
jgi:hypothetical protein